MKRIAIGVGIAIVVAVAAALAAPSFINWTRYRHPIAERISALTGREVKIGGAISFQILPEPQLIVGDVSVANLPGARAPDMVRMQSLTVRVSLLPLLRGRIAVQSITLVRPLVRLEILGTGQANWVLHPAVQTASAQRGAAAALGAVRLDSVTVRDGTVIYTGGPGKKPLRFEMINADLGAVTLAGPYRLQGSMVARGTPLLFRVDLGRWTPDHQAPLLAHVDFTKDKSRLTVDGVLVRTFGTDRFNGTVKADGDSFARAIAAVSGLSAPRLDLPFKLDFQATGDTKEVSLNDIGFQFGGNAMSGAATVTFTSTGPNIDATMAIGYLNLDSFFSRARSLEVVTKGSASAGEGAASATAPIMFVPGQLPTGFSVSLDLRVSVSSFHGGILRDMRFAGSLKNGQLAINRFGALLPGASTIALTGATAGSPQAPKFSGQVTLASADMRAFLAWLGVDTHLVPPGRLTIFTAHIPFSATPQSVSADQIDVHLDQSHLTGQGTLTFAPRPTLGLDLALDRIDLDDYLPSATDQGGSAAAATAGPVPSAPATPGGADAGSEAWSASLAALAAADINLNLHVGEVIYHVVPINGVTLNLQTKDGAIDLQQFKIANAGGGSLVVSGTATGLAAKPNYKGTLALQAPGIGVFARLGGFAPPVAWNGLRGLKLAATVKGDASGFTLSGLDLALGPDQAGGDIELRFASPRPSIRANLTVANLSLDPFLGTDATASGSTATGGSALTSGATTSPSGSASAVAPVWSARPFNLAPLGWADGIAALNAKEITVRGYQIRDVEITATLNNGTVTLNPIRGLLLGGALAAKAHLSYGGNPSFDASFVWKDVDLQRLLFGMAGVGMFSGQSTLSGTLRTNGATPATAIGNLAGKVTVGIDTGAIQGIDVGRLGRDLGKVKTASALIALSNAATSGGRTDIVAAQSIWTIAKGIARTSDAEATFPDGTATMQGWLDLPSWSMVLKSKINIAGYAKAPPLGIALSGAISDPVRRLKTAALEKYVAASAAALASEQGTTEGPAHKSQGKPIVPIGEKAAPEKTPKPKPALPNRPLPTEPKKIPSGAKS